MRKWLKALVVIILLSIIGTAVYLSTRPVESVVTGDVWFTSEWGMGNPPPFAEFDFMNSIFNPTVSQRISDFGAKLIQQGDSPHGWWNLNATKASLKKEITIYKDGGSPSLMLDFIGKRTSSIEWFDSYQSNRASNIGILLVGDVGLGYYNPDNATPRALFIDIWLDNNPSFIDPTHWFGASYLGSRENDSHSGFPVRTMADIGTEYSFKFRIDPYIRESLRYWSRYWNLEKFTLKMVQCYIEAKASKASFEVSRVVLSTS